MANAARDENRQPVIQGVSSADNTTPVTPYVDPTTHRLLVSSSGGSGAAQADNSTFTPGTDSFTPVGAEVDDTGTTAATENKAGILRMSVRRELYAQLRDAAGNERGLNITANNAALTEGVGTAGTPAGGVLSVQGVSGGQSLQTQGSVSHDGVDSGAPVKIGAKANASLSALTLVSAADRTDLFAGLDGVLIVRSNANLEDLVNGNASNTDGTNTQVIAASGAGVKTYITDVTLSNTSSSNIYVELKDGTTVKWTFPVPANSGVTHHFTTPIAGTANTAWNFDPSAATTTVYCSAAGFKSKI